jgi:hypothetical protein
MHDDDTGPGISTINVALPAIEAYRKIDGDGPIAVRHMDQPGNDWNALLTLVFGPAGYVKDRTGNKP